MKDFFKRFIPGKIYIKHRYKNSFHKKLDLKHPQTFNEKLQWLKFYDRKDIYTKMVDKYEAKKYVGNVIGNEYIIPTIGVYKRFNDIDFEKLPNKFVIKCTHDSGGIFICRDKKDFNYDLAKNNINKNLKKNFYYFGREWPYKNVKRRIIIEEYMGNDINDYKFFCFNGKVNFFKIDFDRFTQHGANYYDIDKKILPFGEKLCPPNFNKKLKIPKNIDEMITLAEKLAKDIPFVRVDFYNINGKIYFGEMTFFPSTGFGKFFPSEWDKKIGDMLNINNLK